MLHQMSNSEAFLKEKFRLLAKLFFFIKTG